MKDKAQDSRLLKIIDFLKQKHDCHTIILYGSRARGDYTDISDYDIIAVRDHGEMERACRDIDGVFLDAFIYSVSAIEKLDESFLRIKDGIVVCQKGKCGEKLLDDVKKLLNKGPKPIPEWEKQVITTWHNKMYVRAKRGDIEGNFRRIWLLYDLLESYFKLRDLWYLGPKEAFPWLKNNDVLTYQVFEKSLQNPDLNNIKKLIHQVDASVKYRREVTADNFLFKFNQNNIHLVLAKKEDLNIVQNMAQFYIYEISSALGDQGFKLNENGNYFEMDTLPLYWREEDRYPFLIYVKDELAGFVLINKLGSTADVDWNIGEFFVIGKFQNKGIGRYIAKLCFDKFTGTWEVMVIPENQAACQFWRKTISTYSRDTFTQAIKQINYKGAEDRVVFRFSSKKTE